MLGYNWVGDCISCISPESPVSCQNEETWMQREQLSLDQEDHWDLLPGWWFTKEYNRKQDWMVQQLDPPEKSRPEHSYLILFTESLSL